MTVPMKSGIHITADLLGTEQMVRVIHKAMKIIVGPLDKCELKEFVISCIELAVWECAVVPVSYIRGIS